MILIQRYQIANSMNMIYKNLIIFIICHFSFCCYAQKIEKEKSINRGKFPEKAIEYLNQEYSEMNRVKYYLEKTQDAIFYESKFECKGDFFSVKFNDDGSLYDIEKLITEEEISESAQQKIKSRFDDDFIRWKIKKIQQRNYQGSLEYEIVVEGKKSKQIKTYEFHFSKSGNFLNQEEIESRFTDIIFFN